MASGGFIELNNDLGKPLAVQAFMLSLKDDFMDQQVEKSFPIHSVSGQWCATLSRAGLQIKYTPNWRLPRSWNVFHLTCILAEDKLVKFQKSQFVYNKDECSFQCYILPTQIPFDDEGSVSVLCYMVIYKDIDTIKGTLACATIKKDLKTSSTDPLVSFEGLEALVCDYRRLFESKELADTKLAVGNDVIRAHKMVLVARSPVFAKMFHHETKEKEEMCINITDVSFPVMCDFVYYLYTGELCDLSEEQCLDLYSVADKYAVSSLKTTCSEFLKNTLSIKTATRVLALADAHGDEQLKTVTRKFVEEHFHEIAYTDGWKWILTSNLSLASEVLANITLAIASDACALYKVLPKKKAISTVASVTK